MSPGVQLHQLPQGEFFLLLGVGILLALAGFYFAFRWISLARIIEDTPTAKIRSAQQGYVELVGDAVSMEGLPVVAPLTGTVCCWYRYRIEKRGDKSWRMVEGDTSDDHFILRDETGDCLVDPEGAEVTPRERDVWHGTSRYPNLRSGVDGRKHPSGLVNLARHLTTPIGVESRYRFTEERIHSGERIYAIGQFRSHDELDRQRDQAEAVRELLQQWKRDKATLLARFDRNGDGQIDMQEWEQARQAAREQAARDGAGTGSRALHRLGPTGSRRHPFLLSALPQFDLVRRYRWKSFAAIGLFFLCGGASAWAIGIRLV